MQGECTAGSSLSSCHPPTSLIVSKSTSAIADIGLTRGFIAICPSGSPLFALSRQFLFALSRSFSMQRHLIVAVGTACANSWTICERSAPYSLGVGRVGRARATAQKIPAAPLMRRVRALRGSPGA
jgi:hypothetical protein